MGPAIKGSTSAKGQQQQPPLVQRFRFHDTEVILPPNSGSDLQFVDGELHIELTKFSGSIILKPGKMSDLPSPMAPPPTSAAAAADPRTTTPLALANKPSSTEGSSSSVVEKEKEKRHDDSMEVVKSPLPSTSVVTPSTTAHQSSSSSSKAKLKGGMNSNNKRGAQSNFGAVGAEKENVSQESRGPGGSNKKIKSTPPPPAGPGASASSAPDKETTTSTSITTTTSRSMAEDIEGLEELEMSSQDDALQPVEGVMAASASPPSSSSVSLVEAGSPAIKGGCLPPGRWGHTATLVGGQKMFVFGGQGDDEDGNDLTFGDLFIYDHKESRWEKPINCECSPRAWHSTTYIPDKNILFIFGGERASGRKDEPPEVTADILLFDTEILLFYPPAINGKQPSPRSGHSSSLVGRDILIFGGSRGRKWLSTVSVLDVDRWQWRVPTIKGDAPKGRSYHSATVIDNEVVFFGGNDGNMSFNDVHVLKCPVNSPWEWFRPEVVGCPPSKRTGHTACLLADNSTLFIHGGWDPQSETHEATQQFQDSFYLDTKSWEWLPGPALADVGHRVGHSSVVAPASPSQQGDNDEEGQGSGQPTVLLFGGQDAIGKRAQDLHALHVNVHEHSM